MSQEPLSRWPQKSIANEKPIDQVENPGADKSVSDSSKSEIHTVNSTSDAIQPTSTSNIIRNVTKSLSKSYENTLSSKGGDETPTEYLEKHVFPVGSR